MVHSTINEYLRHFPCNILVDLKKNNLFRNQLANFGSA